jgi:hypothetical protein
LVIAAAPLASATRAQCCDFQNIFGKNLSKKLVFLFRNTALNLTLALKKISIFVVENYDHNIDPNLGEISPFRKQHSIFPYFSKDLFSILFHQDPILLFLHLQLQRQHCSRLVRF